MKKRSPEPDAVLWSLVTEVRDGRFPIRPGWYRVYGGTLANVRAAHVWRTAEAAEKGWGSRFEYTERADDGRCPKPDVGVGA